MDRLSLRLAAAALALSAVIWLWTGLAPDRERPAVCRAGVMEETVTLSGRVSREELALFTDAERVLPVVPFGARTAARAPLAAAGEDARALLPGLLLLRLRAERDAPALSRRQAAEELRRAVTRRDFPALALAAAGAERAFGLDRDEERLRQCIARLERAGAEEVLIPAPAAGFLLPGAGRAWARLATGREWLFCAGTGDPRLPEGEEITVRFPDGTELPARVESASPAVLRGEQGLETLLFTEETELTAVLSHWEGLLLPEAALRSGPEGKDYVLRSGDPLASPVSVEVLSRRDGMALVRSAALRDGMEIALP